MYQSVVRRIKYFALNGSFTAQIGEICLLKVRKTGVKKKPKQQQQQQNKKQTNKNKKLFSVRLMCQSGVCRIKCFALNGSFTAQIGEICLTKG